MAPQTESVPCCPGCAYPLAGLAGPLVTCPECGRRWDLAALETRRREDWVRNDDYTTLARPALLLQLLVLPAVVIVPLSLAGGAAAGAAWALVAVTWWGWQVSAALRRAPGDGALLLLAALHVVQMGYLMAVVAAVGGLVTTIAFLLRGLVLGFDLPAAAQAAAVLVVALLGAALLPLLHRLDREIGRRCVRRSLARLGAGGGGARADRGRGYNPRP